MSESRIIWRGLTVKGMDACLIASHGGNKKTKALLELTLVPTVILSQWATLSEGVPASQQGSTYVKAVRDLIEGVCPSECGFIASGKCYVQHNARNAGQVARIIRGVMTIPALGTCKPAFIRIVAKHAKFSGLSRVRSMVAGDACMIPEGEWLVIQAALCAVFPPSTWLGYTHGWAAAFHLMETHVASCESTDAALRARSIGWSVFQVGAANMQTLPAGARLCPASAEFKNLRGFEIGCNACPMACNGATRPRRLFDKARSRAPWFRNSGQFWARPGEVPRAESSSSINTNADHTVGRIETMKLTKQNTYVVPGLDALIGVRVSESATVIYFASKGCSRTKTGLKRRNPDRRAAIDHVVEFISEHVVVVSGGKAGSPVTVCDDGLDRLVDDLAEAQGLPRENRDSLSKVIRSKGNYRVDLQVLSQRDLGPLTPEDLGLVLRAKS